MRKVFDGGEAVYNLGDNPHGADHVVLTKDNIQDVVVPLFYMAQSKLDVAGATKELREKGFTILKGEKRVHLVTDLNGNAHPVLGATFRRSIEEGDNGLKIHSYDTPETLASEETAKRGIEQYPLEERQGSSFGPDVAPLKSGDHALVESNPATVSEQVDPLTGVELSNSVRVRTIMLSTKTPMSPPFEGSCLFMYGSPASRCVRSQVYRKIPT